MIPELGHFAVIVALVVSITQSFFALAGGANGNRVWMSVARPAAHVQFALVAVAFGCLAYAFLSNDFSVLDAVGLDVCRRVV
jgi:cytochrome c-type biogenesis protein CcmF